MADSCLFQKKITYTKANVESSGYAPITENFINEGMTISELCKAAITQSDNAAMNLIMKKMGGPKQVTLFARSNGDHAFRLDRYEPDLNAATPGDLRDTTTPMAMAKSLKGLAFGNAFGLNQKNQLIGWLKNNTRANDEGMRHDIREIKMAYDFKGVPINIVNILGVAPSVTYIEGQGWAGAMQFFEKIGLGNCSYRENNLKFSHSSAVIPKEDATYDVNGKITVTNVTGDPLSGFMYSVDWYDNNYFRELKCANEKFNPSIMSASIELARIIDSNG